MARTIWIDVEDLLHHALRFRRPSGIQRMAFELCSALRNENPDRVRCLRQDRLRGGYVAAEWRDVVAAFAGMTAPVAATARPGGAATGAALPAKAWLRRRLERLPAELRVPLIAALRAQAGAVSATAAVFGAAWRLLRRRLPAAGAPAACGRRLDELARPGDVLASFGAPWFGPAHPALLEHARSRLGLRVALLLHDIIPLRRPEWCDPEMTALFRAWVHAVLPQADLLFAVSRATAWDVRRYAGAAGIALRTDVLPLPVGSGFAAPPPAAAAARLPAPGGYVLFVSTLEARKNHILLVRAWRHLLEQMPPAELPQLVFAGRVGSMVTDLLAELHNSDCLGGKVVLIEHPDDAELAALYRGCLFTVFPSLYEGWGLPVSESLAFGKPCLAAGVTALPEAGGNLARYFDPESLPDTLRALRAVLDDRAALHAWEAQVRQDFRPVPWHDMARAVIAAVEAADAA